MILLQPSICNNHCTQHTLPRPIRSCRYVIGNELTLQPADGGGASKRALSTVKLLRRIHDTNDPSTSPLLHHLLRGIFVTKNDTSDVDCPDPLPGGYIGYKSKHPSGNEFKMCFEGTYVVPSAVVWYPFRATPALATILGSARHQQ